MSSYCRLEGDIKKSLPISNAFIIKLESCTGTLIADDWVLSAAHCFSSRSKLEENKNEFGDYEVKIECIIKMLIVISFLPVYHDEYKFGQLRY